MRGIRYWAALLTGGAYAVGRDGVASAACCCAQDNLVRAVGLSVWQGRLQHYAQQVWSKSSLQTLSIRHKSTTCVLQKDTEKCVFNLICSLIMCRFASANCFRILRDDSLNIGCTWLYTAKSFARADPSPADMQDICLIPNVF